MADLTRLIARIVLPLALAMLPIGDGAAAQSANTVKQRRFDSLVVDIKEKMLAHPELAIREAVAAEKIGQGLAGKREKAYALAMSHWLWGEALVRLGRTDEAVPLIRSAYDVSRSHFPNSQLDGDVLLSLGIIHQTQGNVSDALISLQRAYKTFNLVRDDRGKAKSLLCLAMLYSEANLEKSALRYVDQAIEIYRGDDNLIISMYNNRANALEGLDRLKEAERQYLNALMVARRLNSPLLQTTILANIARTQLKSFQLKDAEKTLTQAAGLSESGEARALRPRLVAIAAQLALQRHDVARARALIAGRFAGIDLKHTDYSAREAHQTAYETYRALHQPELALAHLIALRRLDDQATKLATNASNALLAARFDYANQELRIANLKADDLRRSAALEHERARTERYLFLSAVGAAALIIAALAFGLVTVRRSDRKVRAANADLAVTNAALGKALATKTEFLATTSHEIRTPLNGILGMTQVLLADRTLAPEMRDRLSVVQGAGETMRALVDDILDVAKIETGNLTVEQAPFDLRATVLGASRLWQDQARAKEIAFVRELDDCPSMIEGDSARVRQIVFNLLSNALKFTSHGRITLKVVTDASNYRLSVSDTGIGIAADKLEEIFESFQQADAGTTRQFGGSGLGLTICRSLARAMGGEIGVESMPGQGSTFTVTLPLIAARTASGVAVAPSGAAALLIVDRNPITSSMFKTLLAPHAEAIVHARSVAEALGYLERGGIAQILLDEATVRADGGYRETLDRITRATRLRRIRVTLLRGAGQPASDLAETGVDVVLERPITGARLVGAMFAMNGTNAALVYQAA